jgi:hypothetical protein
VSCFIACLVRLYVYSFVMCFFHMSPHQFGVAIKGGYKVVVHNIRTVLDVHLDWVVFKVDVTNVFNTILCKAIF